jgi:hypothetical protein
MAGTGEAYFWSSDRVPLCHEHDLADFLAAVGAESGGGGSGGEGRGATVVQQPLTADEARAAAAAEGLELVPSSSSETGFKGVSPNGNSYKAHFSEPRAVRAGPRQPVPLRSARTVGCAQVRAAQPHPP